MKNNFMVTGRSPEKFNTNQRWKHSQDAVYWTHLGRAQEKGMAFWQTKSHANIACSIVLPDCIERVISQHGEMTIYQRFSTPSPGGKLQRIQCCKRRRLVSSRSPSSYKDEERITNMQTLVDRLQDGYRTKSIIQRSIKAHNQEKGNIELFELGETVRTTQCPSFQRRDSLLLVW